MFNGHYTTIKSKRTTVMVKVSTWLSGGSVRANVGMEDALFSGHF